jgi:hypothetical protein
VKAQQKKRYIIFPQHMALQAGHSDIPSPKISSWLILSFKVHTTF